MLSTDELDAQDRGVELHDQLAALRRRVWGFLHSLRDDARVGDMPAVWAGAWGTRRHSSGAWQM